MTDVQTYILASLVIGLVGAIVLLRYHVQEDTLDSFNDADMPLPALVMFSWVVFVVIWPGLVLCAALYAVGWCIVHVAVPRDK